MAEPGWYDCYWEGQCDKPQASDPNFTEWLSCMDNYGLTSPIPQETCKHLDTPEESYWYCYFSNIDCEAATGDPEWYTCHWYPKNCKKPDEPFWDELNFEDYIECQERDGDKASNDEER